MPQTPHRPADPIPAPKVPLREDDAALDTVAALLRALAKTSRRPADTDELDAWARHLLVLSPAPTGKAPSESAGEDGPVPRDWAGARRAGVARIVHDGDAAKRDLADLNDVIWSLVEGTAKIVSENALFDHRVAGSLERLRASVGLPPEELKSAALEAVSSLTEMIDQRRESDALDQELVQRITSLTNDLEEARREAGSDPLTGLASRRVLEEELGRAITMRALSSDPLCVLMIDLDRFKDVNDEFGHVGGDDALRAAAHRLTRVFPRSSDLVARLGGDEFVVLLRYAGLEDAHRLGLRFLRALQDEPVASSAGTFTLSASVGAAAIGSDQTVTETLRRADEAMYAAKRAGGNRLAVG
jgi:diguanylate cyclase